MSDKKERWLLTGVTAIYFCLLMLCPAKAAEAVSGGMEMFIRKLVPVLFPYMVLSHFIGTYGLLDPLNTLLPVGKLFRMDACAFSAFAVGHLCGYPLGAKMTAKSVRLGRLDRNRGALLCGVSSGASPAFLLHVVGSMLWGDIRLGAVLWAAQIGFGLLAGGIAGRQYRSVPAEKQTSQETVSFSQCFCEAVGGSALQLVAIGGYIVFFTLLTALLPFGSVGGTLASVILEFSSGAEKAAVLGGYAGLFLTGFSVGFGGLSVLAQTANMLSGTEIPLRVYVLCRAGCGVFCGTAAVAFGLLFPEILLRGQPAAGTFPIETGTAPVWAAWLLGMMWYCMGMRRGAGR
ncbi:MAG: hypothetical protein IKY52_02180 [Clostridia bacterium]|nr:hypothetical protein [Clostridia bacterium]